MRASYKKYTLLFINPAKTSRNTLITKDTYFVKIWDENNPDCFGVGEAALFRGLGADDKPYYEEKLYEVCENINSINIESLNEWSSIKFGIETALLDFKNGCRRIIADTPFCHGERGIKINGLIWMGSREEMEYRIKEKLSGGFRCLKLKIGGIDFESELSLIKEIRKIFPAEKLELRLDANGAFTPATALEKLEMLSKYSVHSIEQPIHQGDWKSMAAICSSSPIPVALDEELIGVNYPCDKEEMLEAIKPQYIILKPSLIGGLSSSEDWIKLAEGHNIKWWATSAVESDIGLNAIAQWVSSYNISIPQGLGTGQLYKNNIHSPLHRVGECLYYDNTKEWNLSNV
ncbi:MAG: o-succinylbenzoate synthase [Bacteroidales bacterium]